MAAAEAAPPGPLELTRVRVVMLLLTLYVILNYGFMQLRLPPATASGVPIGEIVLILALASINHTATLGRLAATVYLGPFLLWWAYGIGRALIDAQIHGFWALRDAVHAIESLFLVVGFAMVARPELLERVFAWLPRIAVLGVFYGLSVQINWLVWDLSPVVMTSTGLAITLIGIYSNTYIVMIFAAAWLIILHGHRVRANLAAIFVLGYAVFVFQARTAYLIVLAMFAFLALHRRSHFGSALIGLYVLFLVAAALPVFGIAIHGRLGEAASLDFVVQHFLAIFGITGEQTGAIASAADGVGLRLRWWRTIFERLLARPLDLVTGLGYGIPLTDMGTIAGTPVREPHNSYISILARTGLIGAIAWTWMHLLLLGAWRRAVRLAREEARPRLEAHLLLIMIFFIALWVLALGEDGFEKPYNTIPYYVLWGVVLRILHMQERGLLPPEEEFEEP